MGGWEDTETKENWWFKIIC